MTTPSYPSGFRTPLITPYSWDVGMGVLRTPMDSGHARQRRVHRRMPHTFAFEFRMTVQELASWQAWVNYFAYDWFDLRCVVSMYAGQLGKVASVHRVRFISDLSMTMLGHDVVSVKVNAELSPTQSAINGPVTPSYNWIVANDPAAPATPNWYVAGTPATPAPNWVIPGSPSNPTAVV